MILALSGRRIDRADAEQAQFPLPNVERVRAGVHTLLIGTGATWLVSSAACGADLIGLSEAGKLGVRRRVVLPFSRQKFRVSSVVDRPGDWGELYDEVMSELAQTGDVEIVNVAAGEDPFRVTYREILAEAAAIGKERRQDVGAVMVWDGNVRETLDYTSEFAAEAKTRGIPVFEIRTM
jgi:hypothetical protein